MANFRRHAAVAVAACSFGFMATGAIAAEDRREAFFAVPDFQALPPNIEVVSEKTVDGVKTMEFYFAGAPFNGKPTRIYAFYSRPEKEGRYPGVVQLHGAGLGVLTAAGTIPYAKDGFCCISIDWCGPAQGRKEPRKPPYSEFDSPGNLAYGVPEAEKDQAPPHGWRSYGPEVDGTRNGVMFVRRAVMFLKSRPEVEGDKLFLSGMSAGAHLSLLTLGYEPSFKAAAVKYGRSFIRDLCFGGYFGPIVMVDRKQQDAWLDVFDPKHKTMNYKANVLLLSGTDDIFFWMPGVLATYRAIPTDKRLLMLPNDNHSQVGNEAIPLAYFKSVLGLAPAWPTVDPPATAIEGDKLKLSVKVNAPAPVAKVSWWVKRMPKALFRWGRGEEGKPETKAVWTEVAATLAGDRWVAEVAAPQGDEQVVAYAMVSDSAGNQVSSDTIEIPDYPAWRGRADFTPWEQKFKAADFKQATLANPANVAKVKATGNLSGIAPGGKWDSMAGCFEYEVWVPKTGWYEWLVANGGGIEYFLDSHYAYGTEGDKVGSFWLEQGMPHRLKIQKWHWTGFPAIDGFTLRAVPPPDLAKQVRVTVADDRKILRMGETLKLTVETGSLPAPAELMMIISSRQEKVARQPVSLPTWPGNVQLPVEIPCQQAGSFVISFELNGKPVAKTDLRPIAFNVVDTTVQPAGGGEIKKTLLKEIDCVATEPDFKCGDTRVLNLPIGSYRESGDKGYLAHMNSTEPTWFAYKVEVPAKQQLYLIDVDYPDDALRTFIIAIREASPDAYPTAGGVDAGGEFSLSNRMQTHTLMHWARTTDLRVLLIPGLDGRRAAAAKIRVYKVDGELPLPATPATGGRSFGNWYEEGSNFVAMYGAPDRSMDGMLTSADRWARTIRHIGGDTLWMTMAVYQFGLYPTRYNIGFGGPYSADLVRAVLINCEKYGMNFYGEFHPEARELDWPLNADPLRLQKAFNMNGVTSDSAPKYNPLWPRNQEWYIGMIGEFADRYQDSPAFKGVCLRLMSWVNPGLNNFHSLDWGYDDYTIGLFEKETGRKIPVDAGDTKRFSKRHDWLLANARKEWIDWRCAKIEDLYRRIAERVRQARPDLLVLSNYSLDDGDNDSREAGIDPLRLQAIPGVVLVGGAGYGRRQSNQMEVQKGRDSLLDPERMKRFAAADGRCAFLNGAGYFEATEVVATPEDLGFPAGTKRTWMSGVVNPAGRHSLERWAVQLAETDTSFLADGGNAYTVGQPVLRDFLGDYRALPALPFQPFKDARDPVAVWSREVTAKDLASQPATPPAANRLQPGFYFYAVNRERYPVKLQFQLKGADTVERYAMKKTLPMAGGRFDLEIQPYEVCSFRATPGAKIAKVKMEVPEADRKHAEALTDFLAKLAAEAKASQLGIGLRPDQVALLESRTAEAKAELGKGHLWRVRTLLEQQSLREIYNRCQRQPPNLRESGNPIPPLGALGPDDLLKSLRKAEARLVPSQEIAPAWPGETLLVSTAPVLEFEIEIPVDALNGIEIGRVAGGACGDLEVAVNGTVAGKFAVDAAGPRGVFSSADKLLPIRHGKATITVTRRSGNTTALRYLALRPVFTDLVAEKWLAAGPFMAGNPQTERETISKQVDDALRAKDWREPEHKRDIAADFDLGDGTRGRWIPLTGTGEFVNFGKAFDQYFGSISYAVTHIYSPAESRVRFSYGMDYWLKAWLNGELVRDVDPHGGAPFKGQFQFDAPLKAGWNEMLVKVASGSMGNGFWMAVSDPGDLRVEARRQ